MRLPLFLPILPFSMAAVKKKRPKVAPDSQAAQGISSETRQAVLRLSRPDVWALDLGLRVDGKTFSIEGREYIIPVIRDTSDRIVIPKAAQMAFTITFLTRSVHWICERKWNHLYLLPLKTGTTAFVQGRIDPIIDSTKALKEHFQRTDNRMHKQTVDNVNLYIRGTNIETELREIPVDVEVWDERDKMVEDNLTEAEARMDGSPIKKLVMLSTPTVPGHGVDSEDEWYNSDMHLWHIPCPRCGRYQVLDFQVNVKLGASAASSVLECAHCHRQITDDQRAVANKEGRWEATHLNGELRGYHISQLNSPTQPLQRFLKNYFEGQTKARKLKAFFNNQLGEPFVAFGDQFTPELLDRCIAADHRLGGIPGSTVFVGVDVGTMLYVRADWVNRHGQRMAYAFHIFNEFDQLDKFLKSLINFVCVIDAHPEKRAARDLALRYPGKVWIGFEKDRPEQHEIAVFSPFRHKETPKVNIDRTMAFDSVIQQYMTGNVILPPDAREIGEYMARLPYNSFYYHMVQMARVEEEDAQGRIVARWKKNKNPDHFHHADMFCFIATLKGPGLSIPGEISNSLQGSFV
jgi:Phage terminase large subunit (GpA)